MEAMKNKELNNIPDHQMALLSEVYHSINKAKHFPTLAEASSKDEGQTQLGIRNKKHKDIPKEEPVDTTPTKEKTLASSNSTLATTKSQKGKGKSCSDYVKPSEVGSTKKLKIEVSDYLAREITLRVPLEFSPLF